MRRGRPTAAVHSVAGKRGGEMNAGWFKYLPVCVRVRLDRRHGLQAVLGNSTWLLADKVLRMGVGLSAAEALEMRARAIAGTVPNGRLTTRFSRCR